MRPRERLAAAYARIEEVDRPEVWIHLRPEEEVITEAEALESRLAAGETLPLVGATLAVKDNIDVAGIATTAGCPAFAYVPDTSAPAVDRLVEAGALVLGKTNLDQFATGLVGIRSPYGAVRDVRRPRYVSGGSSSGSSVAVALGIADLALGTDTAGSGRVPAAFQGIVGVKPTRGLVPVSGVVPACWSYDCVSVFGPTLADAEAALSVLAGPWPADPRSRRVPADALLAAPPVPRVAAPDPSTLVDLTPSARMAFAAALERLRLSGARIVALDPDPFIAAGELLYEGALVSERHAAVGRFVESHPEEVDPTVGAIIAAAATWSASQLATDQARLASLVLEAGRTFAGADVALFPTTTAQPTIAAIATDQAANAKLGRYTNFVNLLDLCAVAVPAGEADGGQFGVSVIAPAFGDAVAADVARLLVGDARPAPSADSGIELFVAGAHLTGQPLNHQLTDRGARLLGVAETSPIYRMYALDTEPPKPGLVRAIAGGGAIIGERWLISPAALGSLLATVPAPMALGQVSLAGSGSVVGFLCEPVALAGADEITQVGSWATYLERRVAIR